MNDAGKFSRLFITASGEGARERWREQMSVQMSPTFGGETYKTRGLGGRGRGAYLVLLLIEGPRFACKTFVYLRCIQCHVNQMTLDGAKINIIYEGKLGDPN